MKRLVVTNDCLDVNTLAQHMIEMDPYVDFFIIRERSKTVREQIRLLEHVIAAGVQREKLVVNDRVDVAVVMDIPKVQLPGHGLDVQEVKNNFPHLQIGKSIHSEQEAFEASHSAADWLLYGHVFPTNCKPGVPARGVQTLKAITDQVPIDVYAIGGIKPEHLQTLAKLGIKGFAVMSTIFEAHEPARMAEQYYHACQALN
ncbi:thiamine phosphate synthase [Lederbergia ruris]|uniref:Thiamine phosphate synthase n=1 Tax=Lederbergia ruris TaxID=217495 RepID=A0ABQ4KE73_9BACI|nr:thiamine phosphate synthase [Lederbergia ruris]GIN56268.1 thiamine phosphate synthase [Lederbergia ruris]